MYDCKMFKLLLWAERKLEKISRVKKQIVEWLSSAEMESFSFFSKD